MGKLGFWACEPISEWKEVYGPIARAVYQRTYAAVPVVWTQGHLPHNPDLRVILFCTGGLAEESAAAYDRVVQLVRQRGLVLIKVSVLCPEESFTLQTEGPSGERIQIDLSSANLALLISLLQGVAEIVFGENEQSSGALFSEMFLGIAYPIVRMARSEAALRAETPSPRPPSRLGDLFVEDEVSFPVLDTSRVADLYEQHLRPVPDHDQTTLDVSAFAPRKVRPGTDTIVQIYLHESEQAEEVAALAKESDEAATRRALSTLVLAVTHGDRIDVILEAPGLAIDQPAQFLVWRGRARACQFLLHVPSDYLEDDVAVRAWLSVGGAPVGSLRFKLVVERGATGLGANHLELKRGAHRYRRAFLSYSSIDRGEVLKRAQALKAAGVDFFQDLLSLDAGERWERRLYEEIDRCDLFLLFWSKNAASSQWVIAEAEHALKRRTAHDSEPDIVPVVLDGPPLALPPPQLSAIHFNDWLRYVIAAVEVAEQSE